MSKKFNKNKHKKSRFFERKMKFIYPTVIVLLGIVLIATYFFYIPSIDSLSKTKNKYPYLSPGAMITDKKNLLVNFQPLRDSLTNKYEKRDDYMVSIYFEYLPTGANIAVNKDEEIWPASLIKIPVALTAMKKVENGKWSLSNELVILDEDKDKEYGNLYEKPTGTSLTIENFLREALVNSDNTAHFVLLRNIDSNEIEDVYTHLGLDDIITALRKAPKDKETDNRITAKRYSVFFRSLYNATYLNPENSQKFLDILKDAPKEYLSAGLPENIRFVHKTGIRTDDMVRADSGIVYAPDRPYILTVMVQKKDKANPPADGEIENIFKEISKETYDYVKNAKQK